MSAALCLLVATPARAEEPPPAPALSPVDPVPQAPAEDTGPAAAPADAAPPTPAPESAPPPASTAEVRAAGDREQVEALRRELEALKAVVESSQAPAEDASAYEERLRLYGFMDMGFQKLWFGPNAATLGTGTTRAGTFVLGNVNVYIDANPAKGFRGLTEVRFTNYPDGTLPADGSSQTPAETSVADINAADPGWGEVSWSSIVLEQAWIQGTATDWFSVRLGSWLTPFGIWNIDHGSPTVIALNRPQFTRGRFYPERQLGLQLLGHTTSEPWTFGYAVYASNGKTEGGLDPTDDKAFGARLYAATTRPFPLEIGLAGYTGRVSRRVLAPNPAVPLATLEREEIAYRQWDGGVDLSLDVDAFRFRAEFAIERIEYEDDKRESIWGIPGTAWPNRTIFGLYALSAYRLPWYGLEPYVSGELHRFPSPLSEAVVTPGVGLNVHLATEVLVKTQFSRAYFFDFDGDHDHSEQNTSILAARFVLAY